MSAYSDKLKDPRWQRRRLEVLQRDAFRCQVCGTTQRTLHVHHAWYEQGAEPWEAPDASLYTVCEECHEPEHALHREAVRAVMALLAAAGIRSSTDIRQLEDAVGYDIAARQPDEPSGVAANARTLGAVITGLPRLRERCGDDWFAR